MLEKEVVSLINDLKTKIVPAVVILDTHTNVIKEFPNKVAAAKYLGCDREAIRSNRTKLYQKQYKITVLDD